MSPGSGQAFACHDVKWNVGGSPVLGSLFCLALFQHSQGEILPVDVGCLS